MNYLLFFEVLDKEPGVVWLWGLFLSIGIAGFLFSLFNRYLVIAGLSVSLFFAWMFLTEFWDPNINRSIWYEDRSFLPQVYFAIGSSVFLPILGAILNYRKSKTVR
jgi:hypothetical protein